MLYSANNLSGIDHYLRGVAFRKADGIKPLGSYRAINTIIQILSFNISPWAEI